MTTNPDQQRKDRLKDVAEAAGVGIATVDRVLNERGNVSAKTAEKVLNAARRLKLRRLLPSSHHRLLRIEVLLARPELPLISRMNVEFRRVSEWIDRSVVIQRKIVDTEEPHVLAGKIEDTKSDAVIVYAQEHPLIHRAIDRARARGVPLVTIISDLPHSTRLAYAGTDHYAAGRTAGFFMARMMREAGPIAVLCNHFGFQAHEQRVRGFRDALADHAPPSEITDILEGGDDSAKSERLLLEAFRARREIAGFYNVGAANDAAGIALRSGILRRPPVFIGHELTHETSPMLEDGTMTLVIDQNPEQQARFAVDVLLHHFGYTDHSGLEIPYRANIPFRLYSPENRIEPSSPPSA